MRKNLLRYLFRWDLILASVVTLVFVTVVGQVSSFTPDTDETSYLSPILNRLEVLNISDISLDAIFANREMGPLDSNIVVINIGEAAPAPDGKIAALLYKLQSYGVAVIGVDVLLDDKHVAQFDESRRAEVEALWQAIADVPSVMLATVYQPDRLIPALRFDSGLVRSGRSFAYANLYRDEDAVVRRFEPFRSIEGERWTSLAVACVQRFDSVGFRWIDRLPEDQFIINYAGSYDETQRLHIDDILSASGVVDSIFAARLRGTIVLVGIVNERGWFYMGDTHLTPLGRKLSIPDQDGTPMSYAGPDMSGVLVHANIINMLLTRSFVSTPPLWVEYLIAFVLVYLATVLYTLLRTRPTTARGVGFLITALLLTGSILAFFVPILSYQFFHIKIRYDLIATAVLLFIPSNAWVQKTRLTVLARRARKIGSEGMPTLTQRFSEAFSTEEPVLGRVRLIQASLSLLHVQIAQEIMRRSREGLPLPPHAANPTLATAVDCIPGLARRFSSSSRVDESQQFFYRYLFGMKDRLLRDWYVREFLLSYIDAGVNPFVHFDEWEMVLPHAFALLEKDAPLAEIPPAVDLTPLVQTAECKLHRAEEVFIFIGLVHRQYGSPPVPVFAGPTLSCEPVLPEGGLDQIIRLVGLPDPHPTIQEAL